MGQVQSTEVHARGIPLDEPHAENESPIYRSIHCFRENGGKLCTRMRSLPEAATALELLQGVSVRFPDQLSEGERTYEPDGTRGPYQWITFKKFYENVIAFGRGLLELGLKRGDKIGIYSGNCRWWETCCYGAFSVGIIVVPIYDSLGPNAAVYITEHSEMKLILASAYKFPNACSVIDQVSNVQHFVVAHDTIPTKSSCRLTPITAQSLLERGYASSLQSDPATPDDVALIMYTSGTTGSPKGCVLKHSAIVCGAAGYQQANISGTHTDVYLSFLPLAHILGFVLSLTFRTQGMRMAFASGPVKELMADINLLQPTVVCFVPRVYNRVQEAMMDKISKLPFYVRKVIEWAMEQKYQDMCNNRPSSLFIDSLLFSKFRAALGGRIRLLISGGAPLMPEVFKFLVGAITPNVIQGYGLTEACAGFSCQSLYVDDPVLIPHSWVIDIKVKAIEGTDYDAKGEEPAGELLFRGGSAVSEYYKEPKLTEEAFDGEWFKTGDVARIRGGQFQIIDRVKQLVKLSQGEYLSLTKLSEDYAMAKDIEFVYVYGNSMHDRPVAMVVPSKAKIEEWTKQGITDIPGNAECKKFLMERLEEQFTMRKMNGYERLKDIFIETEEPTIENGLITPSMKPQYNAMRKKYDKVLEDLYKD